MFEPRCGQIGPNASSLHQSRSGYARLHQGGNGRGFSRDILPESLRSVHDQIIEVRNKRFAHNDDHHSVSNALGIELMATVFFSNSILRLDTMLEALQSGMNWSVSSTDTPSKGWKSCLQRVKQKTDYERVMPTGPAPE
jgi:hypothetical protein